MADQTAIIVDQSNNTIRLVEATSTKVDLISTPPGTVVVQIPGLPGQPGEDAVVDNSTINAAIAVDPDASRDALGVNDLLDTKLDKAAAQRGPSAQHAIALDEIWRWTVPDGTPVYSSPIFIADFPIASMSFRGPVLIFQGWDWWIYCMNALTGVVIWRKATGGRCYGRCQAADVDGDGEYEVFGASHDGQMWSLTSDGANRYQHKSLYLREGGSDAIPLAASAGSSYSVTLPGSDFVPDCFIRSASDASDNATITIVAGTGSGQTQRISGNSETVIYTDSAFSPVPDATSTVKIEPSHEADNIYQHAGTLNQEGGIWYLYVTGGDFQIVKLNADTGVIQWRYSSMEAIEPYPIVMDVDGDSALEVVIGSIDKNVHCLNASTGVLNWKTAVSDGIDCFLAAEDIDDDGVVEIGLTCRDNRVYILNGVTGAIKWKSHDLGGDGDTRPLFVNEDGVYFVYVVSDAGDVVKFDYAGNVKWVLSLNSTQMNSSPVLITNVSLDGKDRILASTMRGQVTLIKKDGTIDGALFDKGAVEGVVDYQETVTNYGDLTPSIYRAFFVPCVDGYMTCYGNTFQTTLIP